MEVSCCMIVWNEEELLLQALKFCERISEITEICLVIDANSNHKTREMIANLLFRSNNKSSDKRVKVRFRVFDNFANQKNAALDMATKDWILLMDADETYTPQISKLLQDLNEKAVIKAVRIPTLLMYSQDEVVMKPDPDMHVRIWKNGFARYDGDVHETLIDAYGRDLHSCYDMDILTTWKHPDYGRVYMKHYQFLKSDVALKEKGERWERFFESSAKQGATLDKNFWIRAKYEEPAIYGIDDLPEDMR